MSGQPWAPEIVVSLDLARSLIAEAAPELAGAPVEPFGEGGDNTAFLVRGDIDWVFRFPRRTIAASLIEVETKVLPHVADLMKQISIGVHSPRHVGSPSERFPWTFAGYAWLRGEPAADRGLSKEERA